MPGKYIWTPPRRNTEDPERPPLPGMEIQAPRIHPMHPSYHQADNHEVWGVLAHPALHDQNPFLNHPDEYNDGHDYGNTRGRQWRQDYGGYADKWESGDPPEVHPDRLQHHIQRTIDKSLPAIAINTHPLHQVLDSGRVKSQFETHTSGGALEPDIRREIEHTMFGYKEHLAPQARPIYGYLTHDPSVQHPGASGYGDHTLILHRPRVWHRTSAFIGDSLDDQGGGHSAHPVQDFKLSGFPHYANPRKYKLDDYNSDYSYTEAQYHGGVGLRDIHYAVLHKPDEWVSRDNPEGMARYHGLKDKLDQHQIPWVEMENGKPQHWEHHLSRRFAGMMRGANMHQETSKVIGQQGPGRYLIDLGYENENGHRQAQIADTNTGELHEPRSKDSILARGYWDDLDSPVEVHDVLSKVRPT